MRLWKASAVSLFVAAMAFSANAATYYVSTSGNDASNGAQSTPFRTITHASAVTQPGDVVYVRGGVYSEVVKISAKGTSAARIAFKSYPGETAIIDGTGMAAGTDLVTLYQATFVDFSGFEIRNSPHIGFSGYQSNNLRITNNTVHGSVRGGIYVGYSTWGAVTDITIDGNTVYNNVLENQYHTSSGGWAQSISVQNCDRATITNNNVYNNDGEGIVFILSDHGVARKNVVHDNFSVEIYLDNAQTTTVDGNLIYSDGNTRYFRSGYPAAGIGFANESYGTSNPLDSDTIVNNIVINSRWGFYYSNEGFGGGLRNSVISNNTFYKGQQAMIWVDAATHSGTVVENNVFDQIAAPMTSINGSGITWRNNNWYGGTAGAAAGTGDVLADPRLTNPGGLTAADYKLTTGSPAALSGFAVTSITSDYFGTPRGTAFDIGAHQFTTSGATTAPALDTTAPSAPTLSATAASSSSINLTWSASTDNVGVTGYRIYRNGVLLGTTQGTSGTDSGLTAGTTYSYYLVAIDAAGNASSPSNTATAMTFAGADTQAPTAVTNLTVTSTGATSVTLTWTASSDNVGVAGYRIYRNSVQIATTTSTSYSDTTLAAGTTYTYAVVAYDAAGNASTSAAATTTTSKAKRRAASH